MRDVCVHNISVTSVGRNGRKEEKKTVPHVKIICDNILLKRTISTVSGMSASAVETKYEFTSAQNADYRARFHKYLNNK